MNLRIPLMDHYYLLWTIIFALKKLVLTLKELLNIILTSKVKKLKSLKTNDNLALIFNIIVVLFLMNKQIFLISIENFKKINISC